MEGQLSITARITIALHEVRTARHDRDFDRELAWTSLLDRLLDLHLKLLQNNNHYIPLSVSDPELEKRLSVKPRIKLFGRSA